MTITAFHGSRDPNLTEIKAEHAGAWTCFGGLFGGSEMAARSHGKFVYEITSPKHLTDFELNYGERAGEAWELAVEIAGSEERARCILDRACPCLEGTDLEDQGEESWEHQRLRGVLAARLGYTSVEMEDEHGTTYLFLPGCEVRRIED